LGTQRELQVAPDQSPRIRDTISKVTNTAPSTAKYDP
jgi:hypothetical protein